MKRDQGLSWGNAMKKVRQEWESSTLALIVSPTGSCPSRTSECDSFLIWKQVFSNVINEDES